MIAILKHLKKNKIAHKVPSKTELSFSDPLLHLPCQLLEV
jgi:hypothetical protein